MRAKLALVLHLGGVGEYGRLIWIWSVQAQESGDLQHAPCPPLTINHKCIWGDT